MKRTWRALATPVLAIALLAGMIVNAVGNFEYQAGIDFYHLWGIGLARHELGGNPYAQTARYAQALNAVSEASNSARLHRANGFRREIEPTGTPLFYAAFDVLPRDFDTAYALHAIGLFIALLAAAYAMARMRGLMPWTALALAAAVAWSFNPFVQDVKFGNVNALQLAFIVGAIGFSRRRIDRRHPRLDLAYLPALALFVAFKPNTLLVAAFLAAHYALTRGARRTMAGVAASAVAIVVAFAIGAAFFGSWGVWRDWYLYTQGMNGGTLLYETANGNMSLPRMMAERSGSFGTYGYAFLLAAALAFVLGAAFTDLGKRVAGLGAAMRGLLSDPWAAASLGVVFTFATAPLMWPHYLVWALIPIFWLFRAHGRKDAATLWAIVAYALLSRPVMGGLYDAHWYGALSTLLLLGWLPLVPAMYAGLARHGAWAPAAREPVRA